MSARTSSPRSGSDRPRGAVITDSAGQRGLAQTAGIELVRNWPQRVVAVIDHQPHPQMLTLLEEFGFAPKICAPDSAADLPRRVGPCTFVMLGAGALEHEGGRELVRRFREVSPYAPVILLVSDTNRAGGSSHFVEAMRAGATEVIDPDDSAALANAIAVQLKIAGKRRERVLAIGAHPDDIEIGCAGALLNHRRRGDRISFLTLSRGGVGGHQGARAGESSNAAEAIGAQLVMGDLADTRIDEGIDTIRMIESVVAALDPTIVYVHSQHDNHQDHRAVHVATLSATRGVAHLYAYQSPSATNDFRPTKFIPIDDVIVDKVDVLAMFDSQRDRPYLEPEVVVSNARYWARQLAPRSRYAEPFEVIRMAGGDVDASAADPAGAASAPESGQLASVTTLPLRREILRDLP